jgi:hypothetical protein
MGTFMVRITIARLYPKNRSVFSQNLWGNFIAPHFKPSFPTRHRPDRHTFGLLVVPV